MRRTRMRVHHLTIVAAAAAAACNSCCAGAAAPRERIAIFVDAARGYDGPAVLVAAGLLADAGGRGGRARPLRTLGAAQAAARQQATAAGGCGVTVHAAAGTYNPLTLDGRDSGASAQADVRYVGAPGAHITAGVSLPASGFEPVPSVDPVWARLPPAIRAGTRRFNVSALGVLGPAAAGDGNTAVQLSCGGESYSLATWPNNGSWAHTGTPVRRCRCQPCHSCRPLTPHAADFMPRILEFLAARHGVLRE